MNNSQHTVSQTAHSTAGGAAARAYAAIATLALDRADWETKFAAQLAAHGDLNAAADHLGLAQAHLDLAAIYNDLEAGEIGVQQAALDGVPAAADTAGGDGYGDIPEEEAAAPQDPPPRSFPDHPDHLLYESIRELYEAVEGERDELGHLHGASINTSYASPSTSSGSGSAGTSSGWGSPWTSSGSSSPSVSGGESVTSSQDSPWDMPPTSPSPPPSPFIKQESPSPSPPPSPYIKPESPSPFPWPSPPPSLRTPSPSPTIKQEPISPSPFRAIKRDSLSPEPKIEPPPDRPPSSSYWQTVLGREAPPRPIKRDLPTPDPEDDGPALKRRCLKARKRGRLLYRSKGAKIKKARSAALFKYYISYEEDEDEDDD
ncbi:hypothetical protein B0T18DRAFT_441870 [Schizothecium vesticola]|uniref:Uncharacterized protein n=1 Tax=Schizothecium vesticola TaxID=314040 RepID=A0AA40F8W2_9PEZI|nr:hypothetical protein B0T18DRAFT_441870 [Schizothecium vesticola]